MRFTLKAVIGGAFVAACALGAGADVRYTSEMSLGAGAPGGGRGMPGMQRSIFVKGAREREQMEMAIGPIKINNVTITQCDKHQQIRLDPDLKIYTTGPIGVLSMTPPAMPGNPMARRPREAGKSGEGTVTCTMTAQDMGTEKIGDLDTKHSMLNVRYQTSGCLGDTDNNMKMEIWTGSIKTFSCPERFAAGAPRTVDNENGCHITYEFKGDTAAMADAMSGVIVKQIIYMGDKPLMTMQMKDISQDSLDDALFDVPDGFKQLTAAEFQKAEQDGMMKHLRIPGLRLPGNP